MNKPKILINIIPICEKTNTIFIGKRIEDLKLNVVSGKLKYGEEFNEGAARIIKEDIGIEIEEKNRFIFLCSYNILEKNLGIHFVGIMFYLMINQEEIKSIVLNNYTYSSFGFVELADVLEYKDEMYISISDFFRKYQIKNLEDIKALNPS